MYPTIRFARREGKKEPWQQSWKMMNSRTRNAAARTDSDKATMRWPRWTAITITTFNAA